MVAAAGITRWGAWQLKLQATKLILPLPWLSCPLLHHLQLQNKLQEARSTLSVAVDPTTGKKLFHPETGRAPNFARGNAMAGGVSEYLYNLKQQQDDKARAVKEEQERKRVEDMQRGKQSASSKSMVKALQTKRFRQVRGAGCCACCWG
jgi:hypothetical protein